MEPDVLLIDSAYLLAHPNTKLDKFRRVEANVELIKREASIAGIPAILSYQFNREAVKKWKGAKGAAGGGGGMEDIAYADAIGQVSSAVLALRQEETVETANQRKVDAIKMRTEKPFSFGVNWDFHNMDFNEVVEETIGEMKFI